MTVRRSRSLVTRGILKSLVLLGWMASLCGFLWASGPTDVQTYSINLSVIDGKNQPIPNATVAIHSNGGPTSTSTTNAAGKATLNVDGAGSYSLNIQKKGYLSTETTLEVRQNNAVQEVDVVLSEAPLSQQSVEVKGEASSPVTETPSSQATLATAQAKNTALRPATLADALPLIPGIVRAKDGSVRIAGLGEDHSALLVN